jgi:hypothetical protein
MMHENEGERMIHPEKALRILLILMVVWSFGCTARRAGDGSSEAKGPTTRSARGAKPSEILAGRPPSQPPSFKRAEDVPGFVSWAAASVVDEREAVRAAIHAARDNDDVAEALINEIERWRSVDHSRTLVALAVLGEMRSRTGENFLREFVNRPMPDGGTIVDGENIEATAVATLQAKAVAGLAYMKSPSNDAEVLRLAGAHPSRIVRAEAINSYLFNHGDSAAARAQLARTVRQDELIFVDRVRRNPGEKSLSFNRKLAAFLKAHPEAVPPPPARAVGESNPREDHSMPPGF